MNRTAAYRKQPPEGLVEGIGSLGNDIATLVTLQARLTALDLKESLEQSGLSLVALSVALVLTLGAVGLGLLGLGYLVGSLLANSTTLREPTALGLGMLIVAVSALALCGIMAFLGLRKVRASLAIFIRSREELERNLAWVKTVLTQSGR